MIEDLDDETRQEAIRKQMTNLRRLKVYKLPLSSCPVSLLPKSCECQGSFSLSKIIIPPTKSRKLILLTCFVRTADPIRSLVMQRKGCCKACKRSFGFNYGNATYQSNHSDMKWDKYLEGMICSDTLEQLSQKCDISLFTAHN